MRRWLRLVRWQLATLVFAAKRSRGPALATNLPRWGDFLREEILQRIGFLRQTGESLSYHPL
jgi:hypothetical protein